MKTTFYALLALVCAAVAGSDNNATTLYRNPLKTLEKLAISKGKAGSPVIVDENGMPCIQIASNCGAFSFWLDLPEGETVQVSVSMKYQDVKRNDPKKHWTGAAFKAMIRTQGEKTIWRGPARYGSADWQTLTLKINVPLGKQTKACFFGSLEDATGTVWFRDLSIEVLK